jgi:hypothetical protein
MRKCLFIATFFQCNFLSVLCNMIESRCAVNHEFIGKILSSPASVSLSTNPKKASTTPRSPAAATPRISTANQAGSLNTPRVKKSYLGTGPLLISNAMERKELSFFNLLYTDMGFKNCQKFFCDESFTTKGTFTENQFINFMRELTDLGDHQIVEIFDIFGTLVSAVNISTSNRFLILYFKSVVQIVKILEQSDSKHFSCYFH